MCRGLLVVDCVMDWSAAVQTEGSDGARPYGLWKCVWNASDAEGPADHLERHSGHGRGRRRAADEGGCDGLLSLGLSASPPFFFVSFDI